MVFTFLFIIKIERKELYEKIIQKNNNKQNDNTQNEVTKNLSKNSNKKTLCAIGQSDLFKSNASEFFQRNGFKGIESDVFAAGETNYPSVSIGMPAEKSTYPEFILFEKM